MRLRRFSRIPRLLMAGVLALLLLPLGWSWAQAWHSDQVTILMPAPFADASKGLVEQFNAEHRGKVHLQVMRGPLETEAISDLAISSLLLGDAPFDALLMDLTWLPKYAAAGWLEPLSPWFSNNDLEALAPGAREGNAYDGTLYRWPFVASMGLLYWRTDLMDHPPQTPQELEAISQKLQGERKVPWGYVWEGRQYEGLSCVFLEVIDGFGGFWLHPSNGVVGLDQSPGVQAATWLRHLITDGISPQAVTNFAEPEALQSFKVGDAAFMRNWPYAWAELQKDDSAVKGNVGVTTMVAKDPSLSTATLGSWGLALLKGSAHPDAAAEAIRFLTSEAAQKQLFLTHGYTPTLEALFHDPELVTINPILPDLAEALNHTKSRPETPLYAQLSDVLQRDLSAVLTGEIDAAQGMENSTFTTKTIMRSAGDLKQ
ncbi:MAG: ABC transporter substrate-binding protein [Synechococcus sp.]|nr:ABC transporter substrate-binding protein [Synechococcus sp.]